MQFSVAEGGTELGKLTTQDEFKVKSNAWMIIETRNRKRVNNLI